MTVSALTVVLAAAGAVACSSPSEPSDGAGRTGIVIGAASEPDNLNPILGYAPNGASKIFDGLVDRDADLTLRPALAAALPKESPDGLTWTVDLRPGVTFSDGSPVTAEDVVFTFQAVVDPESKSPIAADFEALKSVRAVDTDTVEFALAFPYQPWAQALVTALADYCTAEGAGVLAISHDDALLTHWADTVVRLQ